MATRARQLRVTGVRAACCFLVVASVLLYYSAHISSSALQKYTGKVTAGVARVELSFSSSPDTNPSGSQDGAPGAIDSSDCPTSPKPNLIVSSMDGAKWQDEIFKYMESLEISLAKEVLQHQRAGICLPSPVHVKIIVPPDVSNDLSPSFEALKQRYPHLDFPGALPELDRPSDLTRFIGWDHLLQDIGSSYDRVLVTDLDLVFQRNPFNIRMTDDVSLVFFKEWAGMKLGQQKAHYYWHKGCIDSPGGPGETSYESEAQFRSHSPHEIICDGTTYGSVDAVRIYLHMMSTDIQKSEYGCNEQAMHQHLYYSGILGMALRSAGLGEVVAIANEESRIGTVGWVPMLLYNHWGEVLNELGEVQAVVHQYRSHPKIVSMFNAKYAWAADPGLITYQICLSWPRIRNGP